MENAVLVASKMNEFFIAHAKNRPEYFHSQDDAAFCKALARDCREICGTDLVILSKNHTYIGCFAREKAFAWFLLKGKWNAAWSDF